VTPFVSAALTTARRQGAKTVLVACNAERALGPRLAADIRIVPATGAEVLAGSTRLKAGTATKLVLNTLTTATMTGLGRVYGNRMVDLQPRSAKLRERALRLVADLAGVSRGRARAALKASRGRVRLAIVMARGGQNAAEASHALGVAGGSLRLTLQTLRRK
jgi:N-acetylmuramic acid 6-phosphate etherase